MLKPTTKPFNIETIDMIQKDLITDLTNSRTSKFWGIQSLLKLLLWGLSSPPNSWEQWGRLLINHICSSLSIVEKTPHKLALHGTS